MQSEYWRYEQVLKLRKELGNFMLDKYGKPLREEMLEEQCRLLVAEAIMGQYQIEQPHDPLFPSEFIEGYDELFRTKYHNKMTRSYLSKKDMYKDIDVNDYCLPTGYSISDRIRSIALTKDKKPEKNYHYKVKVMGAKTKMIKTELGNYTLDIVAFKKLQARYTGTTFNQDLALCLIRYVAIFGSGNHQLAIMYYDKLLKYFPNMIELFASPFNHSCKQYFSAFPDVDAPFGSIGRNMGKESMKSDTVYACNPPYDSSVMEFATSSIYKALKEIPNTTFLIIVPVWEKSGFERLLKQYETIRDSRLQHIGVSKIKLMLSKYKGEDPEHWKYVLKMKKEGFVYKHHIINRFHHVFKDHISGREVSASETNAVIVSNEPSMHNAKLIDEVIEYQH